MLIFGQCHCGNVSFELDWQPEPLEIPARACSCSFCAKHGNVWTSCPTGSLNVHIRNENQLSKYSFETKTAEFYICKTCGITPIVTSNIDDRLYAVVNVNTFEGNSTSLIKPATLSTFDGESTANRLTRRKRHWIADVTINDGI